MSSFSEKLQEILGSHQPEEIEDLILDEFSKDIKSFTEDQKNGLQLYTNLFHLSLNNIGLENLNNFPQIKSLMILSLNNNKLKGDDFAIIPELFPNLYKLKISGNKIEKIECLKCLSSLNLRKIEVKKNPFVEKDENYREKIYDIIPSIEIVDQKQKNGQEIDTTDYGNQSSSDEEDYEDIDDDVEDSEESEGDDEGSDGSEDDDDFDEEQDNKKKKKK